MSERDFSSFSLEFTTSVPDAITGMSDPDDEPRVVMSCGHAVDPNTLTAWCRSLLDDAKSIGTAENSFRYFRSVSKYDRLRHTILIRSSAI